MRATSWWPPGRSLLGLILALVCPLAADALLTCGTGTYATGIVLGSGVFKIRGYHDDYLYKLDFLDGNDATSSTVGGSGGTPEVLTVNTANVEYVTQVRTDSGIFVTRAFVRYSSPVLTLRSGVDL
jgi:hypothetical protein